MAVLTDADRHEGAIVVGVVDVVPAPLSELHEPRSQRFVATAYSVGKLQYLRTDAFDWCAATRALAHRRAMRRVSVASAAVSNDVPRELHHEAIVDAARELYSAIADGLFGANIGSDGNKRGDGMLLGVGRPLVGNVVGGVE